MSGDSATVDPIKVLIIAARTNFAAFISAVHRPRFVHSYFSFEVCKAVDQFVEDVIEGRRPVLDLTAPPQMGKSSLVSRCLPGYLIGRLGPVLGQCRIALSSYALSRAKANARDARAILLEPIFREIFPHATMIGFKGQNTADYFDHPFGFVKAQGAGGSLTGFSIDVGLNDDLTANAQDALSQTVQDGLDSWYDGVFTTRLQQRSGQVNIGTPWSAHDIMGRIKTKHEGKPNYKRLSFPAINRPDILGYDPDMPEGSLVPQLHSEEKLMEIKATMAEGWFAAMYQQMPLAALGAIYGADHVRYYRRADLPRQFVQKIISCDTAFRDDKGSDYVFAGVWGKAADGKVYLIDYRRERLSFTRTAEAIMALKANNPGTTKVYIEQASNGHAIIDMLSKHTPGVIGVPPLGSKVARASAVSWVWEQNLVWLPHPEDVPAVKALVAEALAFPDVRNDDFCDGMALALQQLCLRDPISSMITTDILRMAGRRG
ncbi:MAG: phage terminase large subunit [Xanthomonas perforans]|nr:phage terminase large subunit [Xanthomonas perforans]NEL65423.1 phage terminase large subunit [Xanthomonas perforans]NEM12914.1 phage terminase large subunit [Xanthomonas perforans]NEM46252.1 phage terminase large subunit [Xanthomonas perforans]